MIRGPIWLLKVLSSYLIGKLYHLRRSYTDALPLDTSQITLYLPDFERGLDRPVTFDEVLEWLEEFAAAGRLDRVSGPFGSSYALSPSYKEE